MSDDTTIEVEKLGGLAGFGNPGSRLRSRGSVQMKDLPTADRARVDELFARKPTVAAPTPDGFRYRLTRRRKSSGTTHEVVEVMESDVPMRLRDCVTDEFN